MAKISKNGKAIGRPTVYSQALADSICTRLTEGESLREICSEGGYPYMSTVLRWCHDNPLFCEQYTRAREDQGHTDADDVGRISRACARGEIDPSAATAAIRGLTWSAARRLPKKYGDKQEVEYSGTLSVATKEQKDAAVAAAEAALRLASGDTGLQ